MLYISRMYLLLIASVLITVYLTIGIIYFGLRKTNYSAIRHTISELGESGARDEKLVGYGLFLPVGFFLLLFAFAATGTILKGLSACLAAGYIIAALFPCDAGSPAGGSTKQYIHNLGGFIEYAGSAFFLIRASENDMQLFFINIKIFAFIVIAGMITISFSSSVRGLVQRIVEILLFGSLTGITWCCSK